MTKPAHNALNLIGQKFGKLLVIKLGKKKKKRENIWICQCDCGQTTNVNTFYLTSGHTRSCGCLRKKKSHNNKTYKGLTGFYWSSVIGHARSRNIEVIITLQEAADLLEQQNNKCAFSGADLILKKWISASNGQKGYWTEQTASLDRKDSSKPYTKENCQWIHKKFQRLKNNLLDEDFFEMCREVVNFIDLKMEIN